MAPPPACGNVNFYHLLIAVDVGLAALASLGFIAAFLKVLAEQGVSVAYGEESRFVAFLVNHVKSWMIVSLAIIAGYIFLLNGKPLSAYVTHNGSLYCINIWTLWTNSLIYKIGTAFIDGIKSVIANMFGVK